MASAKRWTISKVPGLPWRIVVGLVGVSLVMAALMGGLEGAKGAPRGAASQGITSVSVIAPYGISDIPLFVAAQKFAKKNGLKIHVIIVQLLKDVGTTLAAKRVDVAFGMGPGQALTLVQARVPVRFVFLGDISLLGDAILARRGIKSVADLKGKKVGVELASTGYPMLVYALKKYHLNLSDIKLVELDGASAAVALNTGRIDAAYTWQPYITTSVKKGFRVIFAAKDKPGIIGDLFVVREDVAKNKPDVVVRLLRVWQESVRFVRSNPSETYKIGAKGLQLSVRDARAGYGPDKYRPFDLARGIRWFKQSWPSLAPIFVSITNNAANAPRKITLKEAMRVVDLSFAKKALARP